MTTWHFFHICLFLRCFISVYSKAKLFNKALVKWQQSRYPHDALDFNSPMLRYCFHWPNTSMKNCIFFKACSQIKSKIKLKQ